ncbi:MAG: asparaginase domain-containing protein [Ruminococcus sp.]|nr:asparaginase domain-containing protein [Ruminococcus sp.]
MKILVIMTGGTIGSKTEGNIIDVKSNSYHILDMYNKMYPNNIDFHTIQPFNILSENFALDTLETLGNTLLSADTSKYDGIIVTHGSDTLCYTSSFLGMITRHFDIPIVLVASNYEINNPNANGLDNFHGAIQLIKSKKVRGCFVVWKDSITNRLNIHIGTRLKECDSFTDNFQSYGGVPFAEVMDEEIIFNGSKENPTLEDINKDRKQLCNDIKLKNKSLLIKTYTGLDFSTFKLDNVSNVVIYLYHSGTDCTVSGDNSLIDFIETHSDKTFYIASIKHTTVRYSTTNEILNHNVVPMYDISMESAYIKSLIVSNLNVDIRENLFFESVGCY